MLIFFWVNKGSAKINKFFKKETASTFIYLFNSYPQVISESSKSTTKGDDIDFNVCPTRKVNLLIPI